MIAAQAGGARAPAPHDCGRASTGLAVLIEIDRAVYFCALIRGASTR